MSNVITSFLVGIGFDYDKKSAEQIGSGIDSIKSKALQLGSVVAGAFGIKALTADFAASKDMLGKFAEVFGVTANDVQAFGNALATEGGSLESFMTQLESLERARARIRVGDVGFFAPAGKAGINPNDIANAKSATDAYLGLADSFKAMNQQQRINAAEALGLDEASIRLLSQGREAVEATVAKYSRIRPITPEMTESAAEFNRQWLELSQNVGGFADAISKELVPVINDITKSINSWFDEDRIGKLKAVSELTKATFGAGNPAETAAATGLPEWLFTPIGDFKLPEFPDLFSSGDDKEGSKKENAVSIPDAESSEVIQKVILENKVPDIKVNQFVPSMPNVDKSTKKEEAETQKPIVPAYDPGFKVNQIVPVMPEMPASSDEASGKKEKLPDMPSFGGNVLPLNINVEHTWPAEIIPFSLPDLGQDNNPAEMAQPEIDPSEYMQHTNIVDIVSVQQKTESSRADAMPQRESTRQPQQRIQQAQYINISLNLDGTVIDRRIVRVVDNMAQTAMDDLTSSMGA